VENNSYEISGSSTPAPASNNNWKPWAAGGALVAAMLAGGGSLYVHSSNLENEMRSMRSYTAAEIEALRSSNRTQSEASAKTIAEMAAQIEQAQSNAKNFAAQSRANADRAAKNTAAMMTQLQEAHQAETAKFEATIGELKSASESSFAEVNGKVGNVETEVGTVKTELGNTKSALDTTIAELKSVRGDLGVQSGLIATNAKELAALRELGDRNYFEFTLTKREPTTTLGGVNMKLRKADVKRNKFNLELVSDDKKVEKKDKNLHEPVQFYVGGARQPFEIVVNEISKDKIAGYLATPKVMTARR
jgi:hypothetical protein